MENDGNKSAVHGYKSPARKLIPFFINSRSKWKAKCRAAKYKIKLLRNRLSRMKKCIANLKRKIKDLEEELKTVKNNEQKLADEVEQLKNKPLDPAKHIVGDIFQFVPRGHAYSLGHVHLMLSMILSASISIRGTSRALKIIFDYLQIQQPIPSWYSVRLWLLRLGYYKLTREKTHATDWIWIIDHTIQCGKEKCLAIFGIRQSDLPEVETTLFYEDVEPLALYPVKKSNGDIVYQQLEKTVKITGVPRQIIADGGPDIQAGLSLFCAQHSHTCNTYDIKHKFAVVLKRQLNIGTAWNDFAKKASSVGKQLYQTDMSPLAPPCQRSKSRYMNVDRLVKWAYETLAFMDEQMVSPSPQYDQHSLNAKLDWIKGYRIQIAQWRDLIQIGESAVDFIRWHGFYENCHVDLIQEPSFVAHSPLAKAAREELLTFIKTESEKARPQERLLGSSEVIESLFGKLKYIEKDQSKSGFTVLLLSLAASVSETTQDVVQKALESVPTKKVFQWFKDNVGQSVQSKRKEVKKIARQAEQKWDCNDYVVFD